MQTPSFDGTSILRESSTSPVSTPVPSPTPLSAIPAAAPLSDPHYPPGRQVPKSSASPLFSGPMDARSYRSPMTSQINPISNPATQMNDALRKELENSIINTTSEFLDKLFPPERLPFPVNEDLLKKLSTTNVGTDARPIWNQRSCCFNHPPTHLGEADICRWLNVTGMSMGLVYGRQCERIWWSGYFRLPIAAKSLVGSRMEQSVHLVLLDRKYYDKYTPKLFSDAALWTFVKAVAEVYPNAEETESIGARSYMTFFCQPHRRFTVSLSFFNAKRCQYAVTVTDRAGQIRLAQMDLMKPSLGNGLCLLTILAFLMFGSPEDIGLDPHFEINPGLGGKIFVECENRRFELLKRIHTLSLPFGRGTQVWIVAHEGIRYIMKDSWARENRPHNEAAYLRRMLSHKALEGRVPTLICGGDVLINGVKDSTQRYRSTPCFQFIHRRIVTSPVGEPITSFKSKKEFILAMISIIGTHRYLHDRLGILHRDLSPSNIMLNRKDDESIGLLIDYDYSLEVKTMDPMSGAGDQAAQAAPQVGTPPFMAMEAFHNQNFVHKPQHDLESILYVILYICTFFPGPGLPSLPTLAATHYTPIWAWFNTNEMKQNISYLKLGHLECYDTAILPHFTPYWHDFAPFVKDLITACFPVKVKLPNELRYEKALDILEAAHKSVVEPLYPSGSGLVSLALAPEVADAERLTGKRLNSHSLDRDSKKGKHV